MKLKYFRESVKNCPCMPCTAKQYKSIKKRLIDLGFTEHLFTYHEDSDYLTINLGGKFGMMSNITKSDASKRYRDTMECFDEELFFKKINDIINPYNISYDYTYIDCDGQTFPARRLDCTIDSNRPNLFAVKSGNYEHIYQADNNLKETSESEFILNSEAIEDLPVGTVVVCTDSNNDKINVHYPFHQRIYAGNGECFLDGNDYGKSIDWNHIYKWDGFSVKKCGSSCIDYGILNKKPRINSK